MFITDTLTFNAGEREREREKEKGASNRRGNPRKSGEIMFNEISYLSSVRLFELNAFSWLLMVRMFCPVSVVKPIKSSLFACSSLVQFRTTKAFRKLRRH